MMTNFVIVMYESTILHWYKAYHHHRNKLKRDILWRTVYDHLTSSTVLGSAPITSSNSTTFQSSLLHAMFKGSLLSYRDDYFIKIVRMMINIINLYRVITTLNDKNKVVGYNVY